MLNMRLLYRGIKYIDESFPDYLARLSNRNGFKCVDLFISELRALYKKIYGNGFGYKALDNWYSPMQGGETNKCNLGWFQCRVALEYLLRRSYSEVELNLAIQPHKNYYKKSKVCAICWAENQYVRFYWRDSCYLICHKHEVLLNQREFICYKASSVSEIFEGMQCAAYEIDNCKVTNYFLSAKGEAACSLAELTTERYIAKDERILWKSVISLIHNKFFICCDISIESIIMQTAGLSIPARLENVIKLIDEYVKCEKLIRILAIIYIVKYRLFCLFESNIDSWIFSEAYSISSFLHAVIKIDNTHIFSLGYCEFSNHRFSSIFSEFTDLDIFEFILGGPILELSELKALPYYMNTYVAFHQKQFERNIAYMGALKIASKNIFDIEIRLIS